MSWGSGISMRKLTISCIEMIRTFTCRDSRRRVLLTTECVAPRSSLQVGRGSFHWCNALKKFQILSFLSMWFPFLLETCLYVVCFSKVSWFCLFFFYSPFTSDGMRCCRSYWPGRCLFCCYQPSCIVSQFIVSIYPPPPPAGQVPESQGRAANVLVAHTEEGIEVVHLYSGRPVCQVRPSWFRFGLSSMRGSCFPFYSSGSIIFTPQKALCT